MINQERSQKDGFAPVEFVFVDMILATKKEGESSKEFSNKTSSTYIREYLENERQKEESKGK